MTRTVRAGHHRAGRAPSSGGRRGRRLRGRLRGSGLEVFRDYDMCVIECSIRLAGVMYATPQIAQINVGSRSPEPPFENELDSMGRDLQAHGLLSLALPLCPQRGCAPLLEKEER